MCGNADRQAQNGTNPQPEESVEGGVGGVAGAALLGAIYAAATIIYMETIVIYYGSITDTVITETSGGDRMGTTKIRTDEE